MDRSVQPLRRRRSWGGIGLWILLSALLATGCGTPEPPNIVLIVIDTLRADHLGCYGYSRATSPNIDRLAEQGALFERAHSVSSYTRPSTASILTGLYPSVHGAITHADTISEGIPMLAERLQEAGYATTGFYRNGNVSEKFGFDRGFETYLPVDKSFWAALKEEWRQANPGQKFSQQQHFVSQTDDSILTDHAVPFIRNNQRFPFFLYLHLAGPHDPYAPPRDATSFLEAPLTPTTELFYTQPVKFQNEEATVLEQIRRGRLPVDDQVRQQVVALYDGEIAHSDLQIGAILDALEEHQLTENTLIVLTADHGEELWDHGDLGHGHSNYQELLHVPLMFAGPGIKPRRVAEPVSLIDITPTILDLVGLEPSENLSGKSLAAVVKKRRQPPPDPVYAEGMVRVLGTGDPLFHRSLRVEDLKLTLDFEQKRKQLFDLETDALETDNKMASMPQKSRELLDTLIGIHATNLDSPWLAPVEAIDIPEELEKSLRALGYVGSADDSQSTELFRQPLRRLDLDPYGFLGYESEGLSYLSALDFSSEEFPTEQLLYGWKKQPNRRGRDLMRRAGVRLKREREQESWRLKGHVRGGGKKSSKPKKTLLVDLRVDGGEPQSFTITEGEPFEVSGPMPSEDRSYARFDLTCTPLEDARTRRNDPHRYCLTARSLRLE